MLEVLDVTVPAQVSDAKAYCVVTGETFAIAKS